MRLINAHTLRLENFHNEATIPPYAILSHTWGNSEITFKELRGLNMSLRNARIRIKAKAGYYKITKACAQALIDGLSYCWVDTCCIDKTSSAELSEAINSMFRWYKNAQVCYAYLDDIDLFDPIRSGDIGFAQGNPSRFWTKSIDLLGERDLAKAKWFTRGWTLQELVAPKKVVFYIKGWNFVGNKASMVEKLARITGIDEETLAGGSLEAVSVARRMSWAAKRVTTRVEDIAYCLLGIFDVNMPLLYGEGEKAFVRLQEEIMKDSQDQSLFAWRPQTAKHSWDLNLEELDEWDGNVQLVPLLESDKGRSIFARHPNEFADSHAVRQFSYGAEPYTLTNKGVRMEVPLWRCRGALYVVILDCHYQHHGSRWLGIVVQQLLGGSPDQFVRHDKVGFISVGAREVNLAVTRTVYLCKKVPTRHPAPNPNTVPKRGLTWTDGVSVASSRTLTSHDVTDSACPEEDVDWETKLEIPRLGLKKETTIQMEKARNVVGREKGLDTPGSLHSLIL